MKHISDPYPAMAPGFDETVDQVFVLGHEALISIKRGELVSGCPILRTTVLIDGEVFANQDQVLTYKIDMPAYREQQMHITVEILLELIQGGYLGSKEYEGAN